MISELNALLLIVLAAPSGLGELFRLCSIPHKYCICFWGNSMDISHTSLCTCVVYAMQLGQHIPQAARPSRRAVGGRINHSSCHNGRPHVADTSPPPHCHREPQSTSALLWTSPAHGEVGSPFKCLLGLFRHGLAGTAERYPRSRAWDHRHHCLTCRYPQAAWLPPPLCPV